MIRSLRSRCLLVAGLLMAIATVVYAEKQWRVYYSFEAQADEVALPDDWDKPAGFTVARLMYPDGGRGGFGFGRGRGGDWQQGGTSWTVDYPRGDRYFARILRRLTTIDVRSVEEPVNPDEGNDIFDWPYLVVGLPGFWDLTDAQAKKIREYLDRGGFLLCDSFFGSREWQGFVEGIQRIFPERNLRDLIKDLPADHALFHTVYDLRTDGQVPNYNALRGGGEGYREDGDVPYWRAIRDESGRVMVAIAFNNDLGDSYQYADYPDYPAKGAQLGLRMGVNVVVYALTH